MLRTGEQHTGKNKKSVDAENPARSRERKLRLAAAIAPSLALTVASLSPFDSQSATAATLTWDGGDATFNGSYGVSGTWDLSTLNWSNASADQAWVDTSGTSDTAVFTGTAGTVALNTNLGALGLQFLTTGYTLSGSGTLTLGAGGINASTLTSGTTTISNAVSLLGAQSWTLGTGATLSVGGTVTHNVGSTINFSTNGTFNGSGLLSAVGTQVAGWATIGGTDFAVSNGTKVAATSYTSVSGNNSLSGASAQNWENTATVTLTASGTINSANVVGGDLNVGSNTLTLASGGLILGTTERWVIGTGGTLKSGLSTGELYIHANTAAFANGFQIQPVIPDETPGTLATAVYKDGSGQVEMGNGGNTFSGGFYLNAGAVYLGASSTGSGASVSSGPLGRGTVTLNGGTLNLWGRNNGSSSVSSSYTLGNNVNVPAGASAIIDNAVNNGTLGGNFTGSGTLTIQNSSGTNLSDNLNGSWSGFTGSLNYKTITSTVNIFAGAIDLSNAAVNVSGSNSSSTFRISGTAKLGSLAGSSGYLDSSGGSFQIGNLGTSTTFAGTIVGTGSINKVGAGSLTLSGANSYSAGTTIENGALVAGAAVAVSTNGPFGKTSSAMALGDATSISGNLSPSLLIGGGYSMALPITVGSITTATSGLYTIGGSTDNNSTFSGNISLNQSLVVSQVASAGSNALTISSVISSNNGSTPAVTFVGPGNIRLTNANTYSGATTLSGGTLTVSGSGSINSSSGITINGSGATLVQTSSVASTPAIALTQGTLNGNGTVGNVTVSSLASNTVTNAIGGGSGVLTINNTLAFNDNGALAINIPGGSNTTTVGIATTTFNTANTGSGEITVNVTPTSAWAIGTNTYNLLSFSGVTGNVSDFTKGTIGLLTSRESATLGLSGSDLTLTVAADAPKWTGLDNSNWLVGSTGSNDNWKLITAGTPTDYIDGDAVLFDDSASSAVTPGAVNIAAANVSPTSTTFNNSVINYTVSSTGSFSIAGNGTLTKSGTAALTINAANTYTGGTVVNGGTMTIGSGGALGATTGTLAVNNPNTGNGTAVLLNLSTSSPTTVGSLSGAIATPSSGTNTATIDNGGQLFTVNQTTPGTFAGSIQDNGGFTLGNLTTSTLTLSGASTFSGPTSITAGTLSLTGSLSGSSVTTSGAGILSEASTGAISGNGTSLMQGSSGNSTIAGANTFTGLTTISAGTLSLTGSLSGSSIATSGAGVLSESSTGAIGGNGTTLTQGGSGTSTIAGNNTFTGGTTLSAGTLQFGNNNAFGTGTVTTTAATLLAGGQFTLANNVGVSGTTTLNMASNNTTLSGNISGAAALNITTTGFASTLNLSGNNSGYGGTITFANNDAVSFNSASAGSAAAAWVFNDSTGDRVRINIGNATISFGSISGSGQMQNDASNSTATVSVGALNTNTTFSGTLKNNGTGVLALTKVGTGSLTLTGASSYTGGTTVSAGTIQAVGSALSTGAVTLTGGTIAVNDGVTTTAQSLTTGDQTWKANSGYTARVFSSGTSDKMNITAQTRTLTFDSSISTSSPFTVNATATAGSLTSATSEDWVIAGGITALSGLSSLGYATPTSGNPTVLATAGASAGSSAFVLNMPASLFSSGYGISAPTLDLESAGGTSYSLDVVFNATPEPGTAMLVMAGGLPMLMGRRRRQQRCAK